LNTARRTGKTANIAPTKDNAAKQQLPPHFEAQKVVGQQIPFHFLHV